jgi:hypothetical protein
VFKGNAKFARNIQLKKGISTENLEISDFDKFSVQLQLREKIRMILSSNQSTHQHGG